MKLPRYLLAVALALLPVHPGFGQDKDEPRLVIDVRGHHNVIREILFSPDGSKIYSLGLDKTVRVWNAANGALEKTLRFQIGDGFAGSLFAGSVSDDGRLLAIGGRNLPVEAGSAASVAVIDLATGRISTLLSGHAATIVSLDFAPGGKLLASGSLDGAVRLWNLGKLAPPGENEEAGKREDALILKGHSSGVFDLRFSADGGRLLSASSDGVMKVWDTSPAMVATPLQGAILNPPMTLAGVGARVSSADLSRNGKRVVSGHPDGRLLLWNAETGELIREIDRSPNPFSIVAFSPSGDRFFASSLGFAGSGEATGTAGVYGILDAEDPPKILPVKGNRIPASAWNPAGDRVAFCVGSDNVIQVWKADGEAPERLLTSKGIPIVDVASGFKGGKLVAAFGFLHEGAGGPGRTALEYTFDFETMRLERIAESTGGEGRFSRTSEAGGFAVTWIGVERNGIRLADGTEIAMTEPGNRIRDYFLASDGNIVVCHDFGVTLFSQKGVRVREFIGHEGMVRKAAPSADGKILVTGSEDRTVRLWDYEKGTLLVSLFIADAEKDDWVCWTPNGYFAASQNGGRYFGWHFNRGPGRLAEFLPSERLFDHYYRPDIIQQSVAERTGAGEIAADLKLKFDPDEAQKTAPEVALVGLEAAGEATTQVQTFSVAATPKGKGIAEVRLFHQGKLIEADGPGEKEGEKIVIPYQLSLVSGENEIRAVAVNVDGVESSSDSIRLTYGGEKATSKLHILAVGLNDYFNDEYDLQFCRADAEAFAVKLKENAAGLFRETVVVKVFDAEATRPSIESAFAEIAGKAGPEDVFVFFYAGHGVMGESSSLDDEEFHLIPHDVTQMYGNPAILKEKAISADHLKQLCSSVKATKQLLVIDACQAGGLIDKFTFSMRGAAEEKAIADLARSTGTLVLTATGRDKFAREAEGLGHGLFTSSLINALKGEGDSNNDKQITVFEVYSFVTKNLPELSLAHTGKQQIAHGFIYGTDFPVGLIGGATKP